ncbi:MAG: hypothetical protein FJ291_04250 [Planctomycetes bacterium]|nr:hypothetical protein [Planctomycetota bacterium]
MRRLSLTILILGVACGGPANAGAAAEPVEPKPRASGPLGYLHGRLADLLDTFELSVGYGRGVKLDLRYGLHFLGAGDVRARRLGILDRRVGVWRELDSELSLFPFSLLASPVEEAARLCGCRQLAADAHSVLQVGTEGFQLLDRKELNGDPEFILKDTVEGPVHTRWGDCFPIGAEVQAGVGVRALIRPLQLADFLVGFVGLDLDPWLNQQVER